MTNKLPEVGKRYRHKELKANGFLTGWFLNQVIPFGIFKFDDGRELEIRGLALEDFFSIFQELPEDNSNYFVDANKKETKLPWRDVGELTKAEQNRLEEILVKKEEEIPHIERAHFDWNEQGWVFSEGMEKFTDESYEKTNKILLLNHNVKEYITLTDLINSIESMLSRQDELEARIDKLEGK